MEKSELLESKLESKQSSRSNSLRNFKFATVSPDNLELARKFTNREQAELHLHVKKRKNIAIGDYFEFMINELALKRNNQDFFNALSFDFCDSASIPQPKYAFCDWLKCTQPDPDMFQDFCSKAFPYFKNAGFEIFDSGKGTNGYTHCYAITMNGERAGCFACSDKMGGLFELTGKGCALIQARWEEWVKLTWSLSTLQFRITRLDVSVDLKGYDWFRYGVTVPQLLYKATKEDMFVLGSGAGARPSIAQFGDWSGQNAGDWSREDYDPYEHAHGGLTFNIGKITSANQFCVYEKMKEQLGKKLVKVADRVDVSSVRIERRFGRGTGDSKVVIIWDFALKLDEALTANCAGLEKFLSEFGDFSDTDLEVKKEGLAVTRVGSYIKNKVLKKAYWLSVQGGKCVNTLLRLDFSPEEIIRMIVNPDKGIDGFIDNITNKDDIYYEFKSIKRSLSCA